MATIEIEVDDKGEPVSALPPAFQKVVDRAFGKGRSEAQTQMQSEIDKLKGGSMNPAEREKLKALEVEASRLGEELALRDKNYGEAQAIRDKRHQQELEERQKALDATAQEVTRRTARLEELARKEIRAAALAAGARRESLDELEVILGRHIGLDDALQVFIKDTNDAGKPLLGTDGTPVDVEVFVSQYLSDHLHHKAAPSGRGGGANGGRALHGHVTGPRAEWSAAHDQMTEAPSDAAIDNFLSVALKTARAS